ncbi:MAG: PPC domain-containing DNA-binding protein [Candidatus Njordarchaeales archaeon]
MKVYPSGDIYILVLEPGDEIIESIKKFAKENDFHGYFFGIGAVRNPEIGYFDLEKKEYVIKSLEGEFEVTSLIGNVSRDKNGEVIVHAHITIGDKEYRVFGGHLIKAVVSVTLELFCGITRRIMRKRDEKTGLKIIS